MEIKAQPWLDIRQLSKLLSFKIDCSFTTVQGPDIVSNGVARLQTSSLGNLAVGTDAIEEINTKGQDARHKDPLGWIFISINNSHFYIQESYVQYYIILHPV